jgi:transcriptional regulator with XRE-family HTH domain
MSQSVLAKQVGTITRSHISYLEGGRKTPSVGVVVRIAEVFDVTTDYLLRDSVPPDAVAAHWRVLTPPGALESTPFPAKLRRLRTQRGLSKSALARELGLAAHTFIGLLETGRKEPSAAFTVRLADFFGVTTDYLLWDAIPLEEEG